MPWPRVLASPPLRAAPIEVEMYGAMVKHFLRTFFPSVAARGAMSPHSPSSSLSLSLSLCSRQVKVGALPHTPARLFLHRSSTAPVYPHDFGAADVTPLW